MTWRFTYGTLQDPTVLTVLLGTPPPMVDIAVSGWRVAPLRDKVYPGLVADRYAYAAGKAMVVTPQALALLDAFEDDIYERVPVGQAPGDGQPPQLHAFTIPVNHTDKVGVGLWTLEAFRSSDDYSPYLERVAAWAARWRST